MKKLNVLVTGASGFVGMALLKKLILQGSCASIFAMHRRELTVITRKKFGSSVQWLKADITKDDLSNIMLGVDIVFHLAAYSSIDESEEARLRMWNVNVDGTKRLAHSAQNAGVKQFIFVSSIAACETGSKFPISEDNGIPVSSYGRSKKAAEESLLAMSDGNFFLTILRPTALFGENHLGSVYDLVMAINKKRFMIFGNGNNRTNFYYINDFISVLLAVKNNERCFGQVYIAADQPCSLSDLSRYIIRSLELTITIPSIPKYFGWFLAFVFDSFSSLTRKSLPFSRRRFFVMTRDIAYTNRKLSLAIGNVSSIGLEAGIDNTIAWYRKQGLI